MSQNPAAPGPAPASSPLLVALVLALGAFAIGTSEFAAMGLLPWYVADLGVTDPEGGHVVSAYALGVVVGAPLTSILGARLPRRRYLAGLIAFFSVMNLLAAVLPGYTALVAVRFLAGLPHGGYLGVAMLVAADMMPRHQRARGLTRVMLGLTVANIIGVPLASALGQWFGWRWGFVLPGVLGLLTALLILRYAPRMGADPLARPIEELKALRNPSVILVLLVGAVGFGGMFAVYAYLTAAMLATAAPPDWVLPVTLAVFGTGSTLGTLNAGWLSDRLGVFRSAGLLLVSMALAQGFAAAAVGNWPLMMVSAFLIGATSGMGIPLQARLMDVAGRAQSMAAAMNHAAFNAANALGPWLAGLALAAGWGWRAPGLVGVGLSLAGLIMLAITVLHARGLAQRPGP